jgi:SAM-dependent methyltransferase
VTTRDLPSDISGTNGSDAPSTTRELPTSVETELELTLDRLDSATNYADWVGDRLAPYVSGDVLELGAGSGTLTERLRGRSESLVAVEPYPVLSAELAARFVDDRTVEVITGELDSVDVHRNFDAAVLVNVLEHIEDDRATLSDLYSRLRPDGTLVLFVPAFQLLYSDFDRRIGHHRRYRKRQLVDKMRGAGFDIEEARYFNIVGFPLWLVGMRALRLNPGRSALTTIFDRYAVPVLRRIESVFAPPVGQSLICVGRKPSLERTT